MAARVSATADSDTLDSTGNETADRVVRATLGNLTRLLPEQVLSCYLLGGHAEFSANGASDLDIAVLLAEGVNSERVVRAVEMCTTTSPIHLDVMAVTLRDLVEVYPGFVPVLKVTGRRIWGEDLASQLPWPDSRRYTEHSIDLAEACMAAVRKASTLGRPLEYPDPAGEFFGYDGRIRSVVLSPQQPLRGLVALVARTAIAFVAVRSGKFCTSREEYLRLFREAASGPSAELVEHVVRRCRGDWRYEVPTEPGSRAELCDMCREVLEFERSSLIEFDRATRSRTL